MAPRAYSARNRTGKRRPEDVLGKNSVTHTVNYTMSYFLSADFERLYDKGLDVDGIKSKYLVRLLAGLNNLCDTKVRTGSIRVEELEQLERPLTAAYVRRMRMAKTIEESVGEYVDWTIDARYRALEKTREEAAATAVQAKAEPLPEKEQPQPEGPQVWHGPRENPKPVYQRKRRGRASDRSRRGDETFI